MCKLRFKRTYSVKSMLVGGWYHFETKTSIISAPSKGRTKTEE